MVFNPLPLQTLVGGFLRDLRIPDEHLLTAPMVEMLKTMREAKEKRAQPRYGLYTTIRYLKTRGLGVRETVLWGVFKEGWNRRNTVCLVCLHGLDLVVEDLLKYGVGVEGEELNHGLWSACDGDQERIVRKLLTIGADPNYSEVSTSHSLIH